MSHFDGHCLLVNEQIFCRFRRPLLAADTLVLAIPGGPGLRGQYLEPFLCKLAEAVGVNVALLDLPNHGRSPVNKNILPLSYSKCFKFLDSAIQEINEKCGGVVLFGQSLGARLAFDLLVDSKVNFLGAVLTGLPYKFESSALLEKKLAGLDLEKFTGGPEDEDVFSRNWRKLLPHYTRAPLPTDVFEQLASGTKWIGNERMLEDVPGLDGVATRLKKWPLAAPVIIIQGSDDLVVPDGNTEMLKRMIPAAEFHEIPGAGHFTMSEKPEATLFLMKSFLAKVGVPGV